MGVDYYQCDGCQCGYRDDSEYSCFCDCSSKFCNKTCGELENYAIREEPDENLDDADPIVQDWINGDCHVDKNKPITCIICRGEKFTDYSLLHAILQHFNLTREEAIEIAKKMP